MHFLVWGDRTENLEESPQETALGRDESQDADAHLTGACTGAASTIASEHPR